MRNYRHKTIELLAPAGNLDIFKSIVHSKCDAIYLGGSAFNMRMIRKGYNFSNDDLIEAMALAKAASKRVYITVNNLISESQLLALREYLQFLYDFVKPDALIVQDMAVLQLIKDMGLDFEIHASVMMNVHNLNMIQCLEKHGVSKVVVSREMTLETVKSISEKTDVDLEYFTHGDMCIAHGSQCYYSSFLFGMSSNRGRCLKPCRWWFDNEEGNPSFPLAVKDLALYQYLPEMLDAGIQSFKIEGRMREKDFITTLINHYGEALDRYLMDAENYDRKGAYDEIYKARKRDLSTGYALGKPGALNINERYEGTGKFYSTGKMFSVPTKEKAIEESTLANVNAILDTSAKVEPSKKEIAVKIQTLEQGMVAIAAGVDKIYLSGDIYLPNKPFSEADIYSLRHKMTKEQALYLCTPKMMSDTMIKEFKVFASKVADDLDGVMISHLGLIEPLKAFHLVGDTSLNIYNSQAAKWYKSQGVKHLTASIELQAEDLSALLQHVNDLEVVVYGRQQVMYFDHDFHNILAHENHVVELKNEAGTYDIMKDQYGKTHLLSNKHLNWLPLLVSLDRSGVQTYRIEAATLQADALGEVIKNLKERKRTYTEQDTLGAIAF